MCGACYVVSIDVHDDVPAVLRGIAAAAPGARGRPVLNVKQFVGPELCSCTSNLLYQGRNATLGQ